MEVELILRSKGSKWMIMFRSPKFRMKVIAQPKTRSGALRIANQLAKDMNLEITTVSVL